MLFKKFVQIGGIVYIAMGPDAGKIAAIVNVVDQNRLLIDGPCTGVRRHVINMKHIHLTKFRIVIPYTARTGTVKKAWEKGNISELWAETSWAKKIALKVKKASLTDFDRFTVHQLKKQRRAIINDEIRKLVKEKRKARADKKRGKGKKTRKPKKAAKA